MPSFFRFTSRRVLARLSDKRAVGFILLLIPVAAILYFFIYPIGIVLRESAFDPSFNLTHYQRIFEDPLYIKVFWNTVVVSFWTTVLCVAIGYPMSYFLVEFSLAFQAVMIGAVSLSFFVSLLIKAYSWTLLLQDTGLINQFLISMGITNSPFHLMYNMQGVLIGMVNSLLPFVILPLYGTFTKLDRSLLQASAASGAGPLTTWWNVVLPLSLPSTAAGALLVFIVSLGFYITPALLGGPKEMMLSALIDNQVHATLNWPFASALAAVLLMLTIVVYSFYYYFFARPAVWERP